MEIQTFNGQSRPALARVPGAAESGLLARSAALLEEAIRTHIYDQDNGEEPGPDCPYSQLVADIKRELASRVDPKLVVVVRGGLVEMLAFSPSLPGVNVVVVDHDVLSKKGVDSRARRKVEEMETSGLETTNDFTYAERTIDHVVIDGNYFILEDGVLISGPVNHDDTLDLEGSCEVDWYRIDPDSRAMCNRAKELLLATYRIEWQGYPNDPQPQIQPRAWYSNDQGFDDDDRAKIYALAVGESVVLHGIADAVTITRVSPDGGSQ